MDDSQLNFNFKNREALLGVVGGTLSPLPGFCEGDGKACLLKLLEASSWSPNQGATRPFSLTQAQAAYVTNVGCPWGVWAVYLGQGQER